MLIPSRRKPEQSRVIMEVNIASATDYNSRVGGGFARGARRPVSGGGVVEHVSTPEQYLEFYRSDPSLRTFIETAPHAIIATDADGMIRTCNPFAEELFGYTAAEVFGKPFAALLDPFYVGTAGRSIFCSEPPSPEAVPNIEAKARKKNGEIFPIELVSSRFKVGASLINLHFIRDVSFRQRFEHRISQLQQELNSSVTDQCVGRTRIGHHSRAEPAAYGHYQLRRSSKTVRLHRLAGGVGKQFRPHGEGGRPGETRLANHVQAAQARAASRRGVRR